MESDAEIGQRGMFSKGFRLKKKGEPFCSPFFCPMYHVLIFYRGNQDFCVAVYPNILCGWDPAIDGFDNGGVAGCNGGASRVIDGEGRCMSSIGKKCEGQGVSP